MFGQNDRNNVQSSLNSSCSKKSDDDERFHFHPTLKEEIKLAHTCTTLLCGHELKSGQSRSVLRNLEFPSLTQFQPFSLLFKGIEFFF
jgi:hypothetical protein